MKRRKIDPETKMAAVLEGLRSDLLQTFAANTKSAKVFTIAGGTTFWRLGIGAWLLGMVLVPRLP